MIFLDTDEFTQLQRQIMQRLISEIDGGGFLLNESMGNEQSLASHFAVSRSSIRGVVGRLAALGVVEAVPHRGIFLRSRFRFRAEKSTESERSKSDVIFLRWDDTLLEVEITEGLEASAAEYGFELRVLSACQSLPTVLELIDQMKPGMTLVILPVDLPGVESALARAISRGVRVLQLDRYLEELKAPAITYDDYAAGVLATRHLVEQHNGPVYFFGYKHPVSGFRRWQGWKAVMEANGFYDLDRWIIDCAVDEPGTQFQPEEFFLEAFRRFCCRHREERCAIYCMCDSLAVHVYTVAAERKLRIGHDLLVVGSGDVPYVKRLLPPLSSLHVDQTVMGRTAGKLIVNWPELAGYRQYLPLDLVVRESSLVHADDSGADSVK